MNDRISTNPRPPELALHLLDALQNVYRRAANGEERAPARGFSIAECRPVPAPFAAGDIVSGDPRARSVNMFASADGELDCGVWDCTAGRFRIKYRSDELVHILEGEVTVLVGNTSRVLTAGDVAYFPAGTEAEWDIPTYVRKLWIYRTPPQPELHRSPRGKSARRVASRQQREPRAPLSWGARTGTGLHRAFPSS